MLYSLHHYYWLAHPYFLDKQGHTDAALLIVYAELFFWHTPSPIIDKKTETLTGYEKKFEKDVLYKSYRSWSFDSGLSDDQLRAAVKELRKNLAVVDFGPVFRDSEQDLSNTKVLIALSVEAALEVTYGTRTFVTKKRETPPKKREKSAEEGASDSRNIGHQKTGDPPPETGDRAPESGNHAPESGDHAPETGQLHSKEHNLSIVGTEFPQQHQQRAESGPEPDLDRLQGCLGP
ncbi:MAG: hypothetical protein EOO38_15930 [Cytophagaceae bacterium]|nr:MAG: hypothetical protein EOO38_15930 [Cytophagaceae bacterium]